MRNAAPRRRGEVDGHGSQGAGPSTCPEPSAGESAAGPLESYTATPTTLSLFDSAKMRACVFTKQ